MGNYKNNSFSDVIKLIRPYPTCKDTLQVYVISNHGWTKLLPFIKELEETKNVLIMNTPVEALWRKQIDESDIVITDFHQHRSKSFSEKLKYCEEKGIIINNKIV